MEYRVVLFSVFRSGNCRGDSEVHCGQEVALLGWTCRALSMEYRLVLFSVFRNENCRGDSEAHCGVDVGLF